MAPVTVGRSPTAGGPGVAPGKHSADAKKALAEMTAAVKTLVG